MAVPASSGAVAITVNPRFLASRMIEWSEEASCYRGPTLRQRMVSGTAAVCTVLGVLGPLLLSHSNRLNIEKPGLKIFSIDAPSPEIAVTERPNTKEPPPQSPQPPALLTPNPSPTPIIAVAPPTAYSAPPTPVVVATTSAPAPPITTTAAPSTPVFVSNPACSIPRPAYPVRAKRLQQTGTVLVAMTIASDGQIISQTVRKSSGFDALDTAAIDAVRAGHCRSGAYVSTVAANLPIAFSLDK